MIRVILFIFLILFSQTSLILAQTPLEIPKTLQDYFEAVKSEEEKAIRISWKDLSEDKEALEFLKINSPSQFYLYEIRGLLYEIKKDQSTYEGNLADIYTTDQPKKRKAKIDQGDENQPGGPLTYGERAAVEADRVLPDNGEVALRYPNQDRPANSALTYPNQDRPSNIDIMNSRIDRLYNSK